MTTTLIKKFKSEDKQECRIYNIDNRHYCSYVETKCKKLDYNELDDLSPSSLISGHGGVTFSGKFDNSKKWFFGIDFAHANDLCDLKSSTNIFPKSKFWTLKEVEEETKRFAKNVLIYDKYFGMIVKMMSRQEAERQQLKNNIRKEEI